MTRLLRGASHAAATRVGFSPTPRTRAPRVRAHSAHQGDACGSAQGRASDRAQSTLRMRICTFTGFAPVEVFSSLQSGLPSTKTTAGPGFPEVGVVSLGDT